MTDDADTPFRKLAREFAAQKRTSRMLLPGQSCPSGALARHQMALQESEEENVALFLAAVERIRPLPGDKNKRCRSGEQRGSLGLALAASLGEGESLQQGSRKRKLMGKASMPRQGSPAQHPAHTETPRGSRVDFVAAMHELFQAAPDLEQRSAEEALFAKAMKGVVPLSGRGRDVAAPAGVKKKLSVADPAKALRDVLEGRVEFALHNTDEYMEGYVTGVDPLVLARLRNGQYSPEKHLDLHGMNARQAYEALVWFFRDAYQRGMRTVVVVTGRGRNSPDGIGVLRPLLQRWLCREPFKRVVLAFCTARPGDGGLGAVYILLRKYKKNRGKIIWEHTSSEEDFPDL